MLRRVRLSGIQLWFPSILLILAPVRKHALNPMLFQLLYELLVTIRQLALYPIHVPICESMGTTIWVQDELRVVTKVDTPIGTQFVDGQDLSDQTSRPHQEHWNR